MTTTTRGVGTAAVARRSTGACPRCRRVDQVNTVPRVYRANTQTTQVLAEHTWAGLFLGTTRSTAITTTALGRYLAPPPRRPRDPYRAWLWARFCRRCDCVYFAAEAAGYGAPIDRAVAPQQLAGLLRSLRRR